ncbi:MAG TPA: tetratricopeptide repeat protein, partial [Candidatus Wallbacteria bacterium]|nr:tetratricopeptide repeat protein [Candidatus Wallbacteria bacterium]
MRIKKSLLFNILLLCATAYFPHFYFNSPASAAYNRSGSDAESSQLITYYYNGQYDNALAYLERAIRSDAGKTSRLLEKGHILRQLGEPGKAVEAYREALLAEPDNSAAIYYLALCTYLNGGLETAGNIVDGFYKKKRGASEKYSDEMVFLKGLIEFESARYESAAKTMMSIPKDFQASSQALCIAARSFEKCGRQGEAHDSYIDAYASDPANLKFLVYAAPFMLKVGDIKNAVKFYYILSSKFGGAALKKIYRQVAQMYEKERKNEPAGQSKSIEPISVVPPPPHPSAENEILVGLNTKSDGSPSDIRTLKLKSCGSFSIINEKSGKKIFEGAPGKYYELSIGSAGYSIKNGDSGKNYKLG